MNPGAAARRPPGTKEDRVARTTALLLHDEDWWHAFSSVEEPLLMALDQNTRAIRAGSEDVWETDVDGDAAHKAWGRIWDAMPTDLRYWNTGDDKVPVFCNTDGYEYAALHLVVLDPADVAALAAPVEALRAAVGTATDLADLLREIADLSDCGLFERGERRDPARVVDQLAAAVAPLQLPPDADTELLLATRIGPDGRTVLSADQEAAHRRFIRRFLAAGTPGGRVDAVRAFGHLG